MSTAKAVEITKMDASPSKMVDAGSHTGKKRVSMDTIAALTTDLEAADIIMMNQVPGNAKLNSCKLYNDDLDASTGIVLDVGFYNGPDQFTDSDGTVYAPGALIDIDAIGTLLTVGQGAVTAGTELRFETLNINTVNQKVWELAGLGQDPKVNLRIAITVQTVATTPQAGDISMVSEYIVN